MRNEIIFHWFEILLLNSRVGWNYSDNPSTGSTPPYISCFEVDWMVQFAQGVTQENSSCRLIAKDDI